MYVVERDLHQKIDSITPAARPYATSSRHWEDVQFALHGEPGSEENFGSVNLIGHTVENTQSGRLGGKASM